MTLLFLILELPRKYKIIIMILVDLLLLPIAFWTSIALRLGDIEFAITEYFWLFCLIPTFSIPIFVRFNLYRAVVRYMDDQFLTKIIYGISFSTLLLATAVALLRVDSLPRSSLAIFWVIGSVYIGGSRFLVKTLILYVSKLKGKQKRILIYGAGVAGVQVSYILKSVFNIDKVVFYDDSVEKQNTNIAGLKVLNTEQLQFLLEKKSFDELILALPSITRQERAEIIQKLKKFNLPIKSVPELLEIVNGNLKISDLKEVDFDDLLGRPSVELDHQLLGQFIFNSSVLITGAGGSIGSELCRQIILLKAKKLVMLDFNEFGLYSIEQEIRAMKSTCEVYTILTNAKNYNRSKEVMLKYKVDLVFHTAAYKHVSILEDNPAEAIYNNVLTTQVMAKAALAAKVKRFLLISSDKAVRPSNVMGASKRIAEMVVQAFSNEYSNSTIFSMVRFGNVLGSSGSVVPLFKEQIKRGGPITITHPDVIRYFMTIPEAIQLVIQASAMATGGDVFILNMGEPVKIYDLAMRMIKLSGLSIKDSKNDKGDIEIKFIGLKPGEKLYEELLIDKNAIPTNHPLIMKANEKFLPWQQLEFKIVKLIEAAEHDQHDVIKSLLAELVDGYNPGITCDAIKIS